MRDNRIRPSSEIFSVGEVTGMVVAGVTSMRAAWLFLRMFFESGSDGRFKFLWPLSFDFIGLLYSPTFIVYPDNMFPVYCRPDGREPRLGDILTVMDAGDTSVSRTPLPGDIAGIQEHSYVERIANALIQVPRAGELGNFAMDELEVRYLFTDSQRILKALLQAHASEGPLTFRLSARLIPETKRKRNLRFMVTGVMLAHRLMTQESKRPCGTAVGQPVLFVYQLQEVKERCWGRVEMCLVYNEASMAEWSILEERSTSASGGPAVMSGAMPEGHP